MPGRFTFSKEEKLYSRKAISLLFEKGRSFRHGSYKIIWMKDKKNSSLPARTAISVGKKNIRSAVNRNRIKRLIREAWRKNKHQLYSCLEDHDIQINIMIIFSGGKIPEYTHTEEQIKVLIEKFSLHLTGIFEKD